MNNFDDYFVDYDGLREPFEVLGDEKAEDAQLIAALMQVLTTLSSKA